MLNQTKYSDDQILSITQSNQNPVTISYISPTSNMMTAVPIWIKYFKEKFFMFTGKQSPKVKAIQAGNTNFGMIIINRTSFPVVVTENIPYISMSGIVKIVTRDNYKDLPKIHIELLEKYNTPEQGPWLQNLIAKIKSDPDDVWMVEFTPEKIFLY